MNALVLENGTQFTRIGLFREGVLEDLLVEPAQAPSLVGHIFKGRVERIEEGLDAAFVDIGRSRPGYLGLKDMLPPDRREGARIRDLLRGGQELLVQVLKDPREEKGVQLTTRITLPGRYLVLTPEEPAVSLSHKIAGAARRKPLGDLVASLLPEGSGAVVRTEAQEAEAEALKAEADRLSALWQKIAAYRVLGSAPLLVYREASLGLRMVRRIKDLRLDRLYCESRHQVGDILDYLSAKGLPAPEVVTRPAEALMTEALEQALNPRVPLPGGGSLWIETVRAMTIIDVNSGGRTAPGAAQETFLRVNQAAAREIARQLRIRNLTGMILVDFIDQKHPEARKVIADTLKEAVAADRMPVTVLGFTRLGILELTRKAEQPPLRQLLTGDCPCCCGTGRVPAEGVRLEALEQALAQMARHTTAKSLVIEAEAALEQALAGGALGGLAALGARYGLVLTLRTAESLSGFRLLRG